MPDPDKHDYSGVPDCCRQYREYACYVGGAGTGDIINGMLRGMEDTD